MLRWDVGVSDRDRRGWKLESPPLLVHPGVVASMLEGDSNRISSGSGGAPGSPGFGRLEDAVEEAALTLAPTAEGGCSHFCSEGALSKPAASEAEGLCSPSGWKSSVELLENVLGGSPVVKELLDEELPEAEGRTNVGHL